MAYTLVNGSTVYPAQVSYQLINLTGNIVLSWPSSFGGGPIAAGFNDINPDQAGWTITLPDARLASNGTDVIFNNVSIYTFNILKNDSTFLFAVTPGQIIDFKLYESFTAAGSWRIIPFGGGYNGITAFTAESSNNSITIVNGNVAPPGAIIDFALPASITNLNNVFTTGLSVIKSTVPLTWGTVQLIAGNNIAITNPDGINGNPVINLDTSVAGLTYLQVGDVIITGSVLTTNVTDGGLLFASDGEGELNLNTVTIDGEGNMIVPGNITVTGSFLNPFTPKAWCTFTDVIVGLSNDITIEAQANVASVTGSNGTYTIIFTTPLGNINNYGVLITLGTTGGSLPFVSHGFWTVRESTYVTMSIVDASGELVSSVPSGATIMIMSNN
jgi:hypothetical protein